jgi:hypothetical protein
MLDGIHENGVLIQEITSATEEQSSSIREVTTAVREVDEMTQHNAALVEETNAAIEQTESQAIELDRIVDGFTLAEAAAPARQPARPAASRSAGTRFRAVGNNVLKESWEEF